LQCSVDDVLSHAPARTSALPLALRAEVAGLHCAIPLVQGRGFAHEIGRRARRIYRQKVALRVSLPPGLQ
jgi:hypothetical protein